MKVLFLDIDGVMNTQRDRLAFGMDAITDVHLGLLKQIVDATDCQIVLSSTWRLDIKDRKVVRQRLGQFGLDFIDCTPCLSEGEGWVRYVPRHLEIQEWLENKEIEKFAILDDDPDATCPALEDDTFQTDDDQGLTEEITNQIIRHLKD